MTPRLRIGRTVATNAHVHVSWQVITCQVKVKFNRNSFWQLAPSAGALRNVNSVMDIGYPLQGPPPAGALRNVNSVMDIGYPLRGQGQGRGQARYLTYGCHPYPTQNEMGMGQVLFSTHG
jgi:hypothetical protein